MDTEHRRPSFRFRDRFSHLKDKVKDKVKDKAIKHNITLFVHQNLTSNDTYDGYSHSSRHGFRQQMHHIKDVLKNKTHYNEIKDKIKDKIDDKFDLHHNKTYPKGFYDSLFSPETENDVYLQTALTCLWVIALLCIIPTIIVIFLPARKKKTTTTTTTSTNMIFFHVFLCELFYLSYVLLAMINVAKDFRLGSTLCDFANYGMYVTIPIMQFALLFLSVERLTKHFDLRMTWAKIFMKAYSIQVILCVIWIILIASIVTFTFIKKQFSFNLIKDKAESLAPPIIGDVVRKLASRRHHCSIDGRLSSVFKALIIVLFIILIVKPIIISIGFNLLTPFCCKKRRKEVETRGDHRTTILVTIFLLLNLFFSFPFYIVSMFKSILTNIDSTKETFTIILKICFILRITNIIFECLAYYIFERNSWSLLSKLFYYCTCKKFQIFNAVSDDDVMDTKDPEIQNFLNKTRVFSDEEDEKPKKPPRKTKQRITKQPEPVTESEDDNDDGSFRKTTRKPSIPERARTPVGSDDEKPTIKQKKQPNKKTIEIDEDEEDETKKSESDEDDDEQKQTTISKRKSQIKRQENDDNEDDESKHVTTITTKRKSRTTKPASDDEEHETTTIPKRKSRPKVEEEQEMIEKPTTKSRRKNKDIQIPNGISTSDRPSSVKHIRKTTTKPVQRHSISADNNTTKRRSTQPSSDESEADTASNVSRASSKVIKPSPSPKPVRKQTIEIRPSSTRQNRTISPNDQRSQHRTASSSPHKIKPTTSTHSHQTKKRHSHSTSKKKTNRHTKKPKKDRQTQILEMSHEV